MQHSIIVASTLLKLHIGLCIVSALYIARYQTIHSSQELQGLTTTQSIQSDSHNTSKNPEVRLDKVVSISWTSQNY